MASKKERAEVEKKAAAAREAMGWVQGRLNVLEYLILFFALVLALLGGALVAWVAGSVVSASFRLIWAVASLTLFILPAGFVYYREFRTRSLSPGRARESKPKEPHG